MQNIDNKVFRNLPEQVLWNKEQIESWIENGGVAEIVELTPDPNVFMGDISQDIIDRISGKPLVFVFCGQDVYVKYSEATAVINFLGIRVSNENHIDHTDIKTYQLNILKIPKKWSRSSSLFFETYSKAQLDAIINTLKQNSYQDVDTSTYPTLADFLATTGEEGYIYLYPVNVLDLSKGYMMYIWESNAWRYLGTTALDLSNYYNKSETDALLASKSSKYVGAYVGDETKFTSDMAVGDIIMESTGGQLFINEIEFVSDVLSKVVLVGLEDNGNPVVHKFENGAWSSSNYINSNFGFKKIAKADFDALSNTDKLPFIDEGIQVIGTYGVNVGGGDVINPMLFPRRNYGTYSQGILIAGSSNQAPTVATYELIHSGSNVTIKALFRGSDQNIIITGAIALFGDNTQNVGSATNRLKNIYIAGILSDGTNSVSVADLKALIDYAKAQGWIS